MPKLTKTAIDKAADIENKDLYLWCSEVPGFGVRIQPGGRKTYVVRYRNHTGTQRKMTLARCCDMPPEKARELARKVFADVAAGKDPSAERREAKEAPTMTELWVRYLRDYAKVFKKPSSVVSDEKTWRLYVEPAIGGKKVADVVKTDVNRIVSSLADRPASGNHVISLLGKIFTLAEDWGIRESGTNPLRRYKRYRLPERECILSLEQITDVNRAMDDMVAEGVLLYSMAAMVRLWLLTGCRNSEIRLAERSWVDFNRKLLLLPDSKVGQRRIPLPDAAIEIIKTLPEGKWLIPGRLAGKPIGAPHGIWKRIAARAGIPSNSRPHDLRHTVGSLGHNAGLSQKQIQQQLGHKQMSTTERYIHGIASAQAKAADQIADIITSGWGKTLPTEPAAEPKEAVGTEQ